MISRLPSITINHCNYHGGRVQRQIAGQPGAVASLPELVDTVVAASKGKILIAFDEVQHLAKPEFQELVAALRTTLDVRKKTRTPSCSE